MAEPGDTVTKTTRLVEAAREVDVQFDGKGPGRWTYADKSITDEAAEPLLSLHDYLNDLAAYGAVEVNR